MQSLTREEIEALAEKKLRGTLTVEEEILLNQWLAREGDEKQFLHADEQVLRDRLLKRIQQEAGIAGHPFRRVKHGLVSARYRWIRVAALFVLTIGGVSCFLFFKKSRTNPEMTVSKIVEKQDVAPGHNGAILTLANGHKIVLDSADNGRIALQGNRRLIKKNGQLVYENSAENPATVAPEKRVNYNTVTTPRGRKFEIVLSDGSKVWLNAASSITYPTAFTDKERKVSITGEVYFEIAKDTRHPFVVSVGGSSITVLGTHFNVMAYKEEKQIKTTLLEGAVRVSNGSRQVVIKPGEQASFSLQSDHINVATVDTRPAVAWTEGKLSMDNLGIEAIMRKVSRWYDVDIKFEGPLPQEHFWGVINRNVNLSDMLKVMKASGIEANLHGRQLIVSSVNEK